VRENRGAASGQQHTAAPAAPPPMPGVATAVQRHSWCLIRPAVPDDVAASPWNGLPCTRLLSLACTALHGMHARHAIPVTDAPAANLRVNVLQQCCVHDVHYVVEIGWVCAQANRQACVWMTIPPARRSQPCTAPALRSCPDGTQTKEYNMARCSTSKLSGTDRVSTACVTAETPCPAIAVCLLVVSRALSCPSSCSLLLQCSPVGSFQPTTERHQNLPPSAHTCIDITRCLFQPTPTAAPACTVQLCQPTAVHTYSPPTWLSLLQLLTVYRHPPALQAEGRIDSCGCQTMVQLLYNGRRLSGGMPVGECVEEGAILRATAGLLGGKPVKVPGL
jgi:hypothetical protein